MYLTIYLWGQNIGYDDRKRPMAEHTIDQALKRAVEAHKAGKIQDADRLYTAILKAQPTHPDANDGWTFILVLAIGFAEKTFLKHFVYCSG